MDLSDMYNQIAKMKMSQQDQPDLGQIQHVVNAGINVQNGDPRLKTGFSVDNLRPDELAKWNAYVAKQQQGS